MNWYYVDTAGQQAGPVDDAGLDAMLASGMINSETLIWKEGMANWQPAREIRAGAASAAPVMTGAAEAVCAECGNIFPINDTIRIGNARVCANCKPVFVQKMQEGMSVETSGAYHYAGFWIRWVAAFVDGLILGAFNVVVSMLSIGATATLGGGSKGAALGLVQIILMMIQFGVAITYHTFFIGKYGATPGKMAVRVRVIMADGSPMTYGRAFGRHFAKIINYFTCLIGYIMAGFDDEKRALHDRICATRVVYK